MHTLLEYGAVVSHADSCEREEIGVTRRSRTEYVAALESRSAYIAPSWSWASYENANYSASPAEGIDSGCIRIDDFRQESRLEASTVVIGANPLSRVSDGELIVWGPAIGVTGDIHAESVKVDLGGVYEGSMRPWRADHVRLTTQQGELAPMFLDYQWRSDETPDTKDLLMVLVASEAIVSCCTPERRYDSSGQPVTQLAWTPGGRYATGIVLHPSVSRPGKFYRVGLFASWPLEAGGLESMLCDCIRSCI